MLYSQNNCLGADRCDVCGKTRLLWLYLNKDIGKSLEIMPEGRPEYRCLDCIPEKDQICKKTLEQLEKMPYKELFDS